ncbi:MAG: nucleotidyltransferase domain-containing protein [Methylococcales bacterium]|nr:nucleotidyltransferase domain-containing protein [Methylococcales bacterium]
MSATGLTPEQLELLRQVFKKHPEVEAVKLYGSRANGTFHDRSDVDLVLFGAGIDRFLVADLLLDLADSNLPYAVDLQNYGEIKNRALIEHIDRVGLVIFEREAL